MKRKAKDPAYQNKNGPVTITHRGKGPITFEGYLSLRGHKGSVQVRVTASVCGWKKLRFMERFRTEFADAFSEDVTQMIYFNNLRDKPAKDEWTKTEHKKMKLLTALLFLYFSRCVKQNRDDAIINAIKTMSSLYTGKKNDRIFLLSSKRGDYTASVIRKFKATYYYDGLDIIKSMANGKNDLKIGWELHLLHVEYEARLERVETAAEKVSLTLVYSILSAAMARLFKSFPQGKIETLLLDKRCFVDFGIIFDKELSPPSRNRSLA